MRCRGAVVASMGFLPLSGCCSDFVPGAGRCNTFRTARRRGRLPVERYPPAGGFFPLVATKLTQSPWFLKTPNVFQPPFLHCSFVAGLLGSPVTLKVFVSVFPW